MRLRLRLLIFLIWALLRPRLAPSDESVISLRVLPNDVDLKHVTNDRYLAYMDLGRNDFAVRLGLFAVTRKIGAYPSVRFSCLRFRRGAMLFSKVELRTRLLCWDAEAAWFEQEFFVHGRSIALGYCCAEMRSGRENISIAALLDVAGYPGLRSPEVPEVVAQLRVQVQSMHVHQQRHDQRPPGAA
ncbi:MAG: thioesterase family protein [Betaproteobacteria bacterium]|jgi:acyl-CoA thioesterase FadM|nr:thioesterase family protein [Betaproteobacteria bacterium]